MLDTRRKIETPEGVELMLRVAGPVPRAAAWLIDSAIHAGILIIAAFILLRFGDFGKGLYLVLMFLLLWGYFVFFEVYRHGATPGKRAMKLRVVNRNGTPVGWTASMIRNLLRAVDLQPGFFYGFGLTSMLLNRDFQRLGDIAAGTVVVFDDVPAWKTEKSNIEATPPALALDLDAQRAILAYGDRVDQISKERAEELAAIVSGYLVADDKSASKQLIGNAKWLAGRT